MTRTNRKAFRRAPELPEFTILDVMEDESLLGRHFEGPSWDAWKVLVKSLFALPMSKAEREIFAKHTQRTYRANVHEIMHAVLICGRRAGKSRVLALIGVYLATMVDWSSRLSTGETGCVMILAASKDQARVIFKYCLGMLKETPMFDRLVRKTTANTITLTSGIEIRVTAASFRTTRGVTAVALLLDECAFWWTDPNAAESDVEIARALKPSTMTVPGARTLIASSPYRRAGLLWNEHQRLFGKDTKGELCWVAETRAMNPSIPQSEIDAELLKDYEAAKSEYLALFRDDLEAFLSRDALEPVILRGIREIAPDHGVRYVAGFDGAGGEKGGDSMACAISHFDRKAGYVVLDVVREWKPPFSPEVIVGEIAKLFREYRISRPMGDRWGANLMVELFARHGLTLERPDKTSSDYFHELLPAINSQLVRILDNDRLHSQLLQLERVTSRSGKDHIGHPKGSKTIHDDLSVAVAIALVSAKVRQPMKISQEFLEAARRGPGHDWRNPPRPFEWPGATPGALFPSRIVT